MMRFSTFLLFVLFLVPGPDAHAQACPAPEPVCQATKNVVKISSFEPIGSAVVLSDGLLVTNRHMVADNPNAEVTLSDKRLIADIEPSAYAGDLIFLKAEAVKPAFPWKRAEAKPGDALFVIGFDVGRNAVRVYAPGTLIVPMAESERPRLHHNARSLPGNSGGALVNERGELVGIVTSGGEGRNEALPVSELSELEAASGLPNLDTSLLIGRAYRRCVELMDITRGQAQLGDQDVINIKDACLATNNRQLIDLAAQAFGMRRKIDPALELLERSRTLDPHAPNSLISLAVTYHLAGRYADEIPIVRQGLEILGDDPQLLRLALQAGIWGGDQELADDAMKRIEKSLPQMAPAARNFYQAAPPAPRLRPPQ